MSTSREYPAVHISSRDYWVKVVEMLQQNWALVDDLTDGRAAVFFVDDGSGVFDGMIFADRATAEKALRRNRFARFRGDATLATFLSAPTPPFRAGVHPNGKIYSSGEFWIGALGDPLTGPATRLSRPSTSSDSPSNGLRVAGDVALLPPVHARCASWGRVEGMLLGLAIGDALGNTSESMIPAHRMTVHGEIRD